MPRKNPLPEAEIAAGRRLAQARKSEMIPRSAMALRLGVSTNQLYSYEAGLARLPFGVAERACKILDFSLAWLGNPEHLDIFFEYQLPQLAPEELDKTPFTQVYDEYLKHEIARLAKQGRDDIREWIGKFQAVVDHAIETNHPIAFEHVEKLRQLVRLVEQQADRMLREPSEKAPTSPKPSRSKKNN